jgi:hypothetical protein
MSPLQCSGNRREVAIRKRSTVGRLHRLHENKKEVLVYDYADTLVPMLARMYKKRTVGYSSLGYILAEGTTD